jgi:hypothetical protein
MATMPILPTVNSAASGLRQHNEAAPSAGLEWSLEWISQVHDAHKIWLRYRVESLARHAGLFDAVFAKTTKPK